MRLQLSEVPFDACVSNRSGDLNFCGKISSFLLGGYERISYICSHNGISISIVILSMMYYHGFCL